MLMPGYTIPLTDTGQHGTLDMPDMPAMVVRGFVFMDARREKLTQFLMLMPKPKLTTLPWVTGQQDIMVTTVLMDFTTGTAPVNNCHVRNSVTL